MNEDKTFLGIGWQFPPAFPSAQVGVAMTAYEENIHNSIMAIVTTGRGERFIHTLFGCDLTDDIFESLGTTEINRIKNKIKESLLYFEPRIKVEKINLDFSNIQAGRLEILVQYTVIATNTRNNIVFPFYEKEATDI